MDILLIITFCLGYLAIALEHPLNVNKTASALLTGVLCWVIYILGSTDTTKVTANLLDHLGSISGILFFLLGAMTIVEIIDSHDGFDVITRKINTRSKRKLIWVLGFVTFFLSAVLDNLTTTIVMVSLLRKLIQEKNTRLLFAGIIIIAANAGGAWTPIGDVTTTMLWIGGQVTAASIMYQLFLPSVICLAVPLILITLNVKGDIEFIKKDKSEKRKTPEYEQKLILALGVSALVFVPVFKSITHLPPFMGILFGLSIMWIVTEIIHKNKNETEKDVYSVEHAIRKTDTPSVLFFLGILVAISALESTHQLRALADVMDKTIGNLNLIVLSIGLLSAVVDNVPLVAAGMGMYDMSTYPADHQFWTFLAYCAGTGGSCLIIGSAAGVAAMGIEKINFIWYLKKISWLALVGYLSGAVVFMVQYALLSQH